MNKPACARLMLFGSLFLFSIAFSIAGLDSVQAGPRICPRPGAAQPPEWLRREMAALPETPAPPYGYERLLSRVVQNRRQVAEGTLSPLEAESRGGLAILGNKEMPVFPLLFADGGAEPFSRDQLEDQLFTGPWPTGTMKQYYAEISYGFFGIDGFVADWTTVSEDHAYYAGSSSGLIPSTARTDEAMIEVLDARDAELDFSQWDNDGPDGVPNSADDDGYVDFVMFVMGDRGGECADSKIWSHQYHLSNWTGSWYETDDPSDVPGIENTRIDNYFIAAGLRCGAGGPETGIGVYCHEFGHCLGIKDLYDTGLDPLTLYPDADGVGEWDLMAYGVYNTEDEPAHMSAWTKERLGWLSYFNVTHDMTQFCLPPVETYPVAVRLWSQGEITPEYFVVENRQATGFDSNLRGPGLVIYHVLSRSCCRGRRHDSRTR